jgi:galactose mutarotase-like enzyme
MHYQNGRARTTKTPFELFQAKKMSNSKGTTAAAVITELDPVVVVQQRKEDDKADEDDSLDATTTTNNATIQVFTLHLNGVTVELCSLGASITKWLVPASASALQEDDDKSSNNNNNKKMLYDDIVLGYRSIPEMYESGNAPYFGVIVGRVANRISNGQLWLRGAADDDDNCNCCDDKNPDNNINNDHATATKRRAKTKKVLYPLDINNPPNHLHGGFDGFSSRIWKAEIVELPLPNSSNINNNISEHGGQEEEEEEQQQQQQQQQQKAVQFTLLSPHMDQGYPGTVLVTATYSLVEPLHVSSSHDLSCGTAAAPTATATATTTGARLCLTMKARLILEEDEDRKGDTAGFSASYAKATTTPINLAQHSSFNLSRHDDPMGILSHQLRLPFGQAYTPLNEHSIPTRHVHYFSDSASGKDNNKDNEAVMDFRQPKLLSAFMVDYGMFKAGLDEQQAQAAVAVDFNNEGSSNSSSVIRRIHPHAAASSDTSRPAPKVTYGVDHNYVIVQNYDDNDDDDAIGNASSSMYNNNDKNDRSRLRHVAVLQHDATQRRLDVWSNVPGVQVYTANYLDGRTPRPAICKNGATYRQWQGVCLETQHFPDSIMDSDDDDSQQQAHADFIKGKCVILRPDQPGYEHCVEYQVVYPSCDYTRVHSSSSSSIASGSISSNVTATRTSLFRGSDTNGNSYESSNHMWMHEQALTAAGKREWYERAADYYAQNCPETIDGVLGGFASVSQLDLEGSRAFVEELQQLRTAGASSSSGLPNWSKSTACEMGAGLGRVSKGLLLPLGFQRCDLIESSSRLLSAAPDYLGDHDAARCRFYCTSLQDWTAPATNTYALIWIQWVFCYLVDDDAIAFLRQCKEALVDGGIICLKENSCCTNSSSSDITFNNEDADDFVLDVEDASVTRSVPYLTHLAEQAGLRVVLMRLQDNFPHQLFPVPMLALEPAS